MVGLALALGPVIHAADPATVTRKRVLFFSKSSGFEHEAIISPPISLDSGQ
jgi:hypothetical protein